MKYVYLYLICVSISIIWLSFEIWRAPLVDENYKTIGKEKTFKDLLKKLKLWK